MSKRSRACEFSEKARQEIKKRDGGCIFCKQEYHLPPEDEFYIDTHSYDYMHFIPRSHGGLGIAQNGAIGCRWHHNMLDNGNKGRRREMLHIFEEYLKEHYAHWDRSKLVYDKWRWQCL